MKDNYSWLDSLRETIEGQVNAYTVMKGGKPNAKTLGANMAIDNIMSAVANQIEIEKLRAVTYKVGEWVRWIEKDNHNLVLGAMKDEYIDLIEKLKELEG